MSSPVAPGIQEAATNCFDELLNRKVESEAIKIMVSNLLAIMKMLTIFRTDLASEIGVRA